MKRPALTTSLIVGIVLIVAIVFWTRPHVVVDIGATKIEVGFNCR